jgi:hypothetical protein
MVFDPKIWSHECLPQLLMIKVKAKKKYFQSKMLSKPSTKMASAKGRC